MLPGGCKLELRLQPRRHGDGGYQHRRRSGHPGGPRLWRLGPPVNHYGKPLWETEVSTFDSYDGSISNALYWAGQIHDFLTVDQVNAWHFWWLMALR